MIGLAAPAPAQDDVAHIPGQLAFEVSFSHRYSRHPVSGSLYLILAAELAGEPREKLDRHPMRGFVFRVPVTNWLPGEKLVIDSRTPGYPDSLARVPAARYAVQAIVDTSLDDPDFTRAHGNGRSRTQRMDLDFTKSGRVGVVIDTEIVRGKLVDVSRVFYRRVESRLIGRARDHRFFINVAVVVPSGYISDHDAHYPVQYWIPGHGERARGALKFLQTRGIYNPPIGREDRTGFIRVLIDSHGRHGHHLWTDSPANGPCERAFFDEVIPYVENEFRVLARPEARYLVGHGAGGYSALHLLTHRPGHFAGAWALAPDPVDFRDFYGLNIYVPGANAYEEDGHERTLARLAGKPAVTFRQEARFEEVVGTGNLFQCFDAAFGPTGRDGRPMRLFDRATGAVDGDVAQAWGDGDLRLRLRRDWLRVGAQLGGKIHAYVGEDDNYYLSRPLLLLKDFLEKRNANAHIEVLPGLDYAALDAVPMHLRVQKEIEADWLGK